jgi:cell division protein FtsB
VLRGRRRVKVDHNHIVSHLVMTLEVVTEGLDRVDFDALDEAQMQNWTDSLTTTTRALNRFVKQMKEQVQ